MTYDILHWVLAQEVPSGPKFVLTVLASRAHTCGHSWPSARLIASDTGFATDTVRRYVRQLTERGLLSVQSYIHPVYGMRPNTYTILADGRESYDKDCKTCTGRRSAIEKDNDASSDTTPPLTNTGGGSSVTRATPLPVGRIPPSPSDAYPPPPDAGGPLKERKERGKQRVERSAREGLPPAEPVRQSLPSQNALARASNSRSQTQRRPLTEDRPRRDPPQWEALLEKRLRAFRSHPLTDAQIEALETDYKIVDLLSEMRRFADYWGERGGPTKKGRMTALRNWLDRSLRHVARYGPPVAVSLPPPAPALGAVPDDPALRRIASPDPDLAEDDWLPELRMHGPVDDDCYCYNCKNERKGYYAPAKIAERKARQRKAASTRQPVRASAV